MNEDFRLNFLFREPFSAGPRGPAPHEPHYNLSSQPLRSSGYATLAAGDFLSNPEYMVAINRQATKYWCAKNVQVVVTMKISKGKPGPPRVLAIYFW